MVKQSDPYSNFNTFDGDLYIGSNAYVDQFSGISNFNGTIDDLRLYNVALESMIMSSHKWRKQVTVRPLMAI